MEEQWDWREETLERIEEEVIWWEIDLDKEI